MLRVRSHVVLVILALVCMLPARKVSGQEISPGARLRVTWTDSVKAVRTSIVTTVQTERRVGSLLAVRTERLELASSNHGQPFWVPRQQITQLELSLSRRRHIVPGVLAGIIAAGAFVAPAALNRNGCKDKKGSCFATGMLALGLPLAVLGGFVGSTMGSDRWKQVDVPPAPARF
jgi:hypothetical protein